MYLLRFIVASFFGLVLCGFQSAGQGLRYCAVNENSFVRNYEIPAFSNPRTTIQIPVVFHILWYANNQNISRERIMGQIEQLNKDFNGENEDLGKVPETFRKYIGKAAIHFCLAAQDEFGNELEGILRKQSFNPHIANSSNTSGGKRFVKYDIYGGSNAWDPSRYLNIWVADRNDGILGEATFPSFEDPSEDDGIIVQYTALWSDEDPTNPFNKGRTLTHEIGHYLNLNHPWGSDTGCFGDDDFVKDTPKQEGPYFGCDIEEKYSCGSRDMDSNFMNFREDACLNFFTKGQVDRMIDALFTFRRDLISSKICSESMALPPDPLKILSFQINSTGLGFVLSGLTSGHYTLHLYDITGKKIWYSEKTADENYQLHNPGLSSAVYILTMETEGRRFVRKFFFP